ncbi:hypothetical protein [Paraburkholderia sediminicola]|uniref:hypothetical protein n=1 Tax=Paraburkholderia sediminicola TaxID=458836 RepID=UPI0038BC0A07
MDLTLTIDSRPLTVELDDVIAGLLAVRLNLPPDTDTRAVLCRYLSDTGGPPPGMPVAA